jgi:hypothetical protein
MVILNARINLNNFKPKRENGEMENPNNGGEEF